VTHGRVCHGAVGFHEGTEKVLAVADHPRPPHARDAHRADAGVSRRAIHLHVVLAVVQGMRRLAKSESRNLEALRFYLREKSLRLHAIERVIGLRVVLQNPLE
jgi:hypothetical protein